MITSRQRQFLSPILEWKSIPKDTLVYFEESLRRRLHSAILDAFKRRVKERGLTQKELAKRIHKSPVTVNRWLSTASNLTLDSISDLMVGLGMDFDEFPFSPIEKTVEPEQQAVTSETEKLLSKMVLGEPTFYKIESLETAINNLRVFLGETVGGGGSAQPPPNPGSIPDPTKMLHDQTLSKKVTDINEYRARILNQGALGEAKELFQQAGAL